MAQLGITYFPELPTLAQDPEIDLQYVLVGSWLEPSTAENVMGLFPGKKFLYHYNRNIRGSEAEIQALIAMMRERQRQTRCPWLSAHLDHHTNEEIHGLLREGRRPPHYSTEQALDLICRAAHILQPHLPVPLLLENLPHWPLPEVDVAVTPDFIRHVLEDTQCGLLMDIAHARVTAAVLGLDVRSYLEELPLERVVEVHVSGPRYQDGRLQDCHESLQDEDYALLEWLLRRTTPKAVTLEYWKDPARARAQILRLNQLIARVDAAY